MAVDLPGEIIDPAGIGQAGLGEPHDAEQLALDPPPRPAATGSTGRDCRHRRQAEAVVARGVGIDDRLRPAGAFGAQFNRIGQRKGAPPPIERRLAIDRSRRSQQCRRGACHRRHRAVPRGIVDRPDEPRRLSKARPDRYVARFRAVQPVKITFAEHRIFGDQPVMLERKDVWRDKAVGGREPALRIGIAIVRNDQIEIEHQPVEFAFTQAAAVKEYSAGAARIAGSDRRRHRSDARIDGCRKLFADEIGKRRHASAQAARRRKGTGWVEVRMMGRPCFASKISPSRMTFERSPSIRISSPCSKWTPAS